MFIFHNFHNHLLKLAKIDITKDILNLIITADPATKQFFNGLSFDEEMLKISLALSIKDSRLNTLDLDTKVIENLEKKASYVKHTVEGDKNQVIFSFGFGQDTEFVKELYKKTDTMTEELQLPYSESALEAKKQSLEVEKQNVINVEKVLEEKKEYVEVIKKELLSMKEENEKALEFKKLVQDKLNK